MKRLSIILVLICSLLSVSLFIAYLRLGLWVARPVSLKASVNIVLKPGEKLKDLAQELEAAGVIDHKGYFYFYVKLKGIYEKFQAGPYLFDGVFAPRDVIETMLQGKIFQPITLELGIPEGASLEQIFHKLVSLGYASVAEFKKLATSKSIAKEFGFQSPTLEGFLYPATYRFYDTMPTPREIIERGVLEFRKRLPQGFEEDIKAKGLTLEQGVTFASLIERETLLDDERELISEIIWTRLGKGDPLGIDATIIYGIKDYAGDLKMKHLKDATNPYNTRIHKGLPPTPIASPSVLSLEAVLKPASKGYYFYVLTPGTVRHRFSKTLEEHNAFVRDLVHYKGR